MPKVKKTPKRKVSPKKGKKKQFVIIDDDCLKPFYIQQDEKQYIIMEKGNTLPVGYHINLSLALASIAKKVMYRQNSGNSISLMQYVERAEEINNEIINKVKL